MTFTVEIGSQTIELPIVPVADDVAIALFMTIDTSLSVVDRAGEELADLVRDVEPDVVVTAATLGIPVAMSVARSLGHDRIVVLQKTNKIHLADALTESLDSITTEGRQELRLDRAAVPLLDGQRVAFVDDVISTGGSVAAALRLIRRAKGDPIAVATVLVEGTGWRSRLDDDADSVRHLGRIPLFRRSAAGDWTPDWA